ncbi:hypothetical protein MTO96_035674, partial [Rhipicephalus appendiculatus]
TLEKAERRATSAQYSSSVDTTEQSGIEGRYEEEGRSSPPVELPEPLQAPPCRSGGKGLREVGANAMKAAMAHDVLQVLYSLHGRKGRRAFINLRLCRLISYAKKPAATFQKRRASLRGGCRSLVTAVGGSKRRFKEAFVVEQPDDPCCPSGDHRLPAVAGFLPSHCDQGLGGTIANVPPPRLHLPWACSRGLHLPPANLRASCQPARPAPAMGLISVSGNTYTMPKSGTSASVSWLAAVLAISSILTGSLCTEDIRTSCSDRDILPRKLVDEIHGYAPVIKSIINAVVHGSERNKTYEDLALFVDTFGARYTGTAVLERSIRLHGPVAEASTSR